MDYPSGQFTPPHLICSSLRQHPVWASVTAQLLQADGRQWRANLRTHDLTISIPQAYSEDYKTYQLLLFSSEDVNNEQAHTRIQNLTNAHNAAIIFLLDSPSTMSSFMELHIR
ncbi:hypothetical protein N0V88_004067 [Collariella sp. IMI 366227]|nr:hypothetical protein N0V88_004067 [Collariella sp. IMI 366227]